VPSQPSFASGKNPTSKNLTRPCPRSKTLQRFSHLQANPLYALRKGLGVWELYFDGQRVLLKHERGLFYVYWLLYHPDETPIHAIDLMAKVPEIYRQQLGLAPLVDPVTGKVAPLLSGARLQERSLALDDRQAMRAIFKKEKELEAILDSEDESEPVKAEALREFEEIVEFQKHHARRSKDSARMAAHSVRQALNRFVSSLLGATGTDGTPDKTLGALATHIKNHILLPSATARTHPGCFAYDSPQGLTWH
jgi:hypothetical protein